MENGWITYPDSTHLTHYANTRAYKSGDYGIVNTFQHMFTFSYLFSYLKNLTTHPEVTDTQRDKPALTPETLVNFSFSIKPVNND